MLTENYLTTIFKLQKVKKNNALNSFHSLIFKLPNDKLYTDKHLKST